MFEKLKSNKLALKLISVAFAVVVWLILIYSVDPVISQQVNNVPVTISGEAELADRGFAVINKSELGSASVKIRGERTSVIKAMSVINANINISDIDGVGEWTEYVSFDTGVAGVMVDGRSSVSVKVEVDELVKKKVPVFAQQSGGEKDKQTIIGSVPEVEEMTVQGAKSELAELKAIAVSVDISDVEADSETECKYYFINNDDEKKEFTSIINPPETIRVKNTVYTRKTVSLQVQPKYPSDRIKIDVKSLSKEKIDIGVDRDAVLEIESLPLVFDTNLYSEEEDDYRLTVEAADGIYVPPESREINAKLVMKQLTISDVQVKVEARNIPSGLKARLTNEVVTLTVAAPNDISPEDKIKAYIDLSDKEAGRYEMQITVDAGNDITVLETAHIGVVLS